MIIIFRFNWSLNIDFSFISFIGFLILDTLTLHFLFSSITKLTFQYRPSQWSWRRGEARYTAATIHMWSSISGDPVTVNAKLSSKFPINCSRTCRVSLQEQNASQNVYSRWPVARQVCTQSCQYEIIVFLMQRIPDGID